MRSYARVGRLAAWMAVAAAAALLAYAVGRSPESGGGVARDAGTAGACPPVPRGGSRAAADEVGRLFVRSAVLGQNPACSYDLVTANVRRGRSRARWAAGDLPFARVRTRLPQSVQATLIPRVNLTDQIGSWLVLAPRDGAEQTFELVLLLRGGRWLVDYWGPVPGFG